MRRRISFAENRTIAAGTINADGRKTDIALSETGPNNSIGSFTLLGTISSPGSLK
jgi:hypothetical protein